MLVPHFVIPVKLAQPSQDKVTQLRLRKPTQRELLRLERAAAKLGRVSYQNRGAGPQRVADILWGQRLRDRQTGLIFNSVYGWLQHIKDHQQEELTHQWLDSVLGELDSEMSSTE